MFLNSPPIIEIYDTGYALQNKTYLTGQYARANWECVAKNDQNNSRNTGSHNWPKTFYGRCIYKYIYIYIKIELSCRATNSFDMDQMQLNMAQF